MPRRGLVTGLWHETNTFSPIVTDRARFEVENNVGWGLGDNMYSGSVVVRGNAGAIAGVALGLIGSCGIGLVFLFFAGYTIRSCGTRP